MSKKIIFTNGLIDLAQPRLGTKVIFKTDDFFASANRIINPLPPIFKDGLFDKNGKWMDGWESRRKRTDGHDYLIIRLGKPGSISKVDVDTAHFNGNQPEMVSIEGAFSSSNKINQLKWNQILPKKKIKANSHHFFSVKNKKIFTQEELIAAGKGNEINDPKRHQLSLLAIGERMKNEGMDPNNPEGLGMLKEEMAEAHAGKPPEEITLKCTSCNTFYKGDVVKCTVCNAGAERLLPVNKEEFEATDAEAKDSTTFTTLPDGVQVSWTQEALDCLNSFPQGHLRRKAHARVEKNARVQKLSLIHI